MRLIQRLVCAAALLFSVAAPAQAVLVIDVREIAGGVVFEATGSLDLTGLTLSVSSGGVFGQITPSIPQVLSINSGFDMYSNAVDHGPLFGDANSGLFAATSVSGNTFGFGYNGLLEGNVRVPRFYVSGDPIVGSMLFAGQTVASLLLHYGTYTYNLTNDLDHITVNIVDPTPLPGALPLFAGGLGVMAFLARRRKQKDQAA